MPIIINYKHLQIIKKDHILSYVVNFFVFILFYLNKIDIRVNYVNIFGKTSR